MTVEQIENNVNVLAEKISKDTFIFDLLLAFGFPNATIKRLQNSEHNQLLFLGELALRKHLFFRVTTADELYSTLEALSTDPRVAKHSPRFIFVTDYSKILTLDTKTKDTLDIQIEDIAKHYDFFLPWAGMEKATYQDENPADVKASLKMAKLYDELQKNNSFKSKEEIHSLNVFLTRLLFCYFAEDTNIFADNLFTASIESHTQTDGSDLDSYLERLFEIFNKPEKDRGRIPAYLNAFPYVNGGLFREAHPVPKFTAKSRAVMIEVGGLNWSEINPDIFGSMIQAVVTPEHRGTMGMHYTSVPNIMKVIEPLFLDELYEEFKNSYDSKGKLQHLLTRLANIKIFDPACGSGNFLIIAYKKLREFEMGILQRIDSLSKERSFQFSAIKLSQFYGIELDDFAHEVAMLSLWLAEHQMNLEFYKAFGRTSPSLPLHDGGNIVCGNATRLNWEEVCPKNDGDEIYILGNPPYVGSRMQSDEQKEDMHIVCASLSKKYKTLDYVSIWFIKGADFIKNVNARVAFVSTNSVTQGEQVALLWKNILIDNIEIYFAYQSFKWKNNAKGNAGVTVVIIGLSCKKELKKYIFCENTKQLARTINPYLSASETIYLKNMQNPISKLPNISAGNYTGHALPLSLSDEEKNKLVEEYPEAHVLIKKLLGSQEFLNGEIRWCLWIKDEQKEFAEGILPIKKRIEEVKKARLASKDESANKIANRPHQYRDTKETSTTSVIIPTVSSEIREYIPIGFINSDVIVSNRNHIIYDTDIYIFGVVSSKMHNVWVQAVAGRLETRINYSSDMCYNNFPFPNISQKQKDEITELVFGILDEREKHSQKTLAQLYDPDKMPEGLRKAHHVLDIAIERCYRSKPFESDEERLEYLFKMYEEMTSSDVK